MSSENHQLKIGDMVYSIGDMIACFSTLSQESFSGMISDLNFAAMIVVCGNSVRLSFSTSQIREGRVIVSSDLESIQTLSILSKYIRMLPK